MKVKERSLIEEVFLFDFYDFVLKVCQLRVRVTKHHIKEDIVSKSSRGPSKLNVLFRHF